MMGQGQMGQPGYGPGPQGFAGAGGSGPFGAVPPGALVQGQQSAKPDRTMAIVAGAVGVVLILCAVLYAVLFMKPA